MTYITSTSNISSDRESFSALDDRIQPHARGLIARYAGMNEQGLVVTAVWESKADADRFVAEHLAPTAREMFGDAPPTGITVEFEAFDEFTGTSR